MGDERNDVCKRDVIVSVAKLGRFVALASCAICANVALAQSVKIVGLGASTCQQYLSDIQNNVAIEREYISWAQGYLSGLLIRAPAGVDENLDLTPPSFPLLRQAEYLRTFCATQPKLEFPDAVQELYRTLRTAHK